MTNQEEFEFIEELGERFPDMSDDEVCLAYTEFTDRPLNPRSPVGLVVIHCYNHGMKAAAAFSRAMFFDIDMTSDKT